MTPLDTVRREAEDGGDTYVKIAQGIGIALGVEFAIGLLSCRRQALDARPQFDFAQDVFRTDTAPRDQRVEDVERAHGNAPSSAAAGFSVQLVGWASWSRWWISSPAGRRPRPPPRPPPSAAPPGLTGLSSGAG